ncbi:helix-turn-helix transcriptional regulator [Myxococcaceae bacterium JPH2]|nr:helix-turn-helix transcriptional regulator [Myxococcaceae bacterium JPH2]
MDPRNATDTSVGETEGGGLRRYGLTKAGVGLHVESRIEPRGPVTMAPLSEHLLLVQIGRPSRMTCLRRHRCGPGDASLLPVGFSGSWVDETPRQVLSVRLAPALLRIAADDLGLPPESAGLSLQHHFRDERVEHIVHALEADRAADRPNGRLYTESLGLALAAHLLRHHAAPVEPRSQLSRAQLRRIEDYIEAHLDQNLSLVRLARLVDVSTSHFRTLFKRTIGLPVHQYVIQRRVERAKRLLLEGTLPASQVALEAGFSHQSHMARAMRRHVGVTPTVFARSAPGRSAR